MKTICVFDLINNNTVAQITHNTKIDWLELNEVAAKLLFRDKKMRWAIQMQTFSSIQVSFINITVFF